MSKFYDDYLKSKHWQEFKKELFRRVGKECQDCGGNEKIQVHHLNYKRLWCEEYTDVVALCRFLSR